jgi:hypothetical protein
MSGVNQFPYVKFHLLAKLKTPRRDYKPKELIELYFLNLGFFQEFFSVH